MSEYEKALEAVETLRKTLGDEWAEDALMKISPNFGEIVSYMEDGDERREMFAYREDDEAVLFLVEDGVPVRERWSVRRVPLDQIEVTKNVVLIPRITETALFHEEGDLVERRLLDGPIFRRFVYGKIVEGPITEEEAMDDDSYPMRLVSLGGPWRIPYDGEVLTKEDILFLPLGSSVITPDGDTYVRTSASNWVGRGLSLSGPAPERGVFAW